MSKYTLTKLSSPGWERHYNDLSQVQKELYAHICGLCRKGVPVYNLQGEEVWHSEPITETSSIDDMLCTDCGCEYHFEENVE
jgi:hypothetical protein